MVYLDFSTDGLPLEFGDNKLLASLNLSGMISPERRSIAFYDNRIVLEKNPFLGPTDIRVSGNLDNGNLHINNILWKDDLSVISGNGKLLLPYAGSDQFNGWLTLNSEDDEKYKFLFFRDQDSYSGYGEIENFIAERIALIEKEGKISAKLNFSSIPDNPRGKRQYRRFFRRGRTHYRIRGYGREKDSSYRAYGEPGRKRI